MRTPRRVLRAGIRSRRRNSGLVAVLLLASFLGSDAPAHADRGVSIDLGRIAIDRDLSKGGTYTLPTLGVRNPGDESTRYQMGINYLTNQTQSRAPADWFTFTPAEFELAPGETQPVQVEISVPPLATPDDYAGLLQASIVSEGIGVSVGASASSRLSFTVKPSSLFEAWLLRIQGFIEDNLLVLSVGTAVIALGVVGWWARRTFSFRFERR